MRKIIEIQHVEEFISKAGKNCQRTYVLLDTGEECVGFGAEFKIGDLVEVFFHKEIIKCRKPKNLPIDI